MFEKTRSHLFLILCGTLLSALSVVSIITFTEPNSASMLVFLFLYAGLFLSTLGICTLIGLLLRRKFKAGLYINNLSSSLRQGILLSLLIVTSLLLASQDLLYWWVSGSLVLFLLFIEIFFNV